jgi:hypothetical protein
MAGKLEERGSLDDLGVDRGIIKVMLKIKNGRQWTGFMLLRMGAQWLAVANTVINSRVP